MVDAGEVVRPIVISLRLNAHMRRHNSGHHLPCAWVLQFRIFEFEVILICFSETHNKMVIAPFPTRLPLAVPPLGRPGAPCSAHTSHDTCIKA